MSYADEAAVIRRRIADRWSVTPIDWPNSNFDPLKDDGGRRRDPAPWIRPTIITADARVADIATSPRYRHVGLLIVQIFVPVGTGDGIALQYGDDIAAIFRGVTDSGIRFYGEKGEAAKVVPIGPDGKGWFQVNVEVPMYRDTIF